MDMLSSLGGGIADLVGNLGLGFGVALSLKNLGLCFLGCLIGTLIGVLPGVGPIATITMLLPITFGIDPVGALIMLAGIYYGAQYGGSTTAILVNIPGEATSVVTTLDGHQMAKQGRAGVALGISAIGSFFAGCVSTVIIAALATPLTKMALLFGPADYFSLMVLGLMFAVVLARGSVARAIAVILVGVLLSTVGTDLESGEERLTFGWSEISDGLDVAVLAMGLFGFAEILKNLETTQARDVVHAAIGNLLPNRKDFRQSAAPIVRGTLLGSLLGLLPGNGAVLGPFASYTLEKKLAADPSRFGKGAIEGVAGPEVGQQCRRPDGLHTAPHARHPTQRRDGADGRRHDHPRHRAGAADHDQAAAAVLGNDRLHVARQPDAADHQPAADRPVGALPEGALPPDVPVDRAAVLHRHLLGCQFADRRLHDGRLRFLRLCAAQVRPRARAPLLGFVLGRLMEEKLRQALVIARGHMTTFVDCQPWLGTCAHPISTGLLVLSLIIVIVAVLPSISKSRDEVFQDAD